MLEQTIAGIQFKNPIIATSGCIGFGMEYKPIFDPNILGGLTLQTLTVQPILPLPIKARLTEVKSGMLHTIGSENPGIEFFSKTLKNSLERFFTVPIFASVLGSSTDEYMSLVSALNDISSIAAIELNVSSINTVAENLTTADIIAIVKAVRPITKKPLFLKLQSMQSIREIVLQTEIEGINGFTLINSLPGLKIDTKRFFKPIVGNSLSSMSGPAIMPIALATVYEARKYTQLPIIGVGGVNCLDDAMEFIMAGANIVGIGSGLFHHPLCAQEIIQSLPDYIQSKGKSHISEFIGIAQL